ncbi:hypothetical protein [Mechercharimyces sp. CAU 1602]|uniref:hypothetical protein n=1 Tax=Mechercharimyces sp. CAU 1602 TaxID=2973933 RepID=UPI0021626B37|nr:hypothetical protein [Mechercharimyces sp. CAU 1602]MCS1351737.1 hypothetical protein [Mechercharimyces sp. CAU 1602]
MKRYMSLFLSTVVILFVLSACSSNDKQQESAPTGNPPTDQTATFDNHEQIIAGLDLNQYIVDHIGIQSEEGIVFAAHEVLGTEVKENKLRVYVWAKAIEYNKKGGELQEGSAIQLPLALFIEQLQDGSYQITQHYLPQEGVNYMDEIKNIFPSTVIEEIKNSSGRSERLTKEILTQAKQHYSSKN